MGIEVGVNGSGIGSVNSGRRIVWLMEGMSILIGKQDLCPELKVLRFVAGFPKRGTYCKIVMFEAQSDFLNVLASVLEPKSAPALGIVCTISHHIITLL